MDCHKRYTRMEEMEIDSGIFSPRNPNQHRLCFAINKSHQPRVFSVMKVSWVRGLLINQVGPVTQVKLCEIMILVS